MRGGHRPGGVAVPATENASGGAPAAVASPAARGPLKVLLYAVVLSGLVPALLLIATAGGPGDSQPGLIAVMVVAGLRFSWILGSPVRHLHELVIWVFVYVFLGMAPLVQLRLGVEPETASSIRLEYVPTATVMVLLGSLAVVAGSWAARNHHATAERAPSPDPLRVTVLAVLGIVLGAYYVGELGVRDLFLSVVETSRRREEVWPDPALATLVFGVVSMSLLVAAVGLIKVRRGGVALTATCASSNGRRSRCFC